MAHGEPLIPAALPMWNLAEPPRSLPSWAVADEVARMPVEERRHIGRVCGPAVWYAAMGVTCHVLLWLLTPLAEFALMECPEDARGGLVPVRLDFLTLIGYVLLFAPPHLFCQWKIMRYTIATQLNEGAFCFMGWPVGKYASYSSWLVVTSVLTCMSTLNALTNGQILGRTLATYACGAPYDELQRAWQAIMRTSFIRQIPGFHHSDFLRVSLWIYGVQLVTPLFALFYAVPTDLLAAEYGVREGATSQYHTLYNQRLPTNHGSVVMVLSSLARYEAVTFQDATHAESSMQAAMDRDDVSAVLRIARSELDRSIAKFFLLAFLQDALQTNLQTTLVGMDWRLAESVGRTGGLLGGLDLQMFISVSLCFLCTMTDLLDALDVFKVNWRVQRLLPPTRIFGLTPEQKRMRRHVRSKFKRFTFYLFTFVGFSTWSLFKVVALFACGNHLWNFHPEQLLLDLSFKAGCA